MLDLSSLAASLASLSGTHRLLTLSIGEPVTPPSTQHNADPDAYPADAACEALPSGILSTILVVEAFLSVEALHEVGVRDVMVLCCDAHLPLKHLVSRRATVGLACAGGQRTIFSGLIQRAERLGSQGGLARYRLRLAPWTWLLSQSSGCRVWQDASVIDIVGDIFTQYQPHADWRWTAEARTFLEEARVRPFTVQYRETDLAFVSRLLAEEGITWRLEECERPDSTHAGNAPAADLPPACGHTLVLLADTTDASSVPQDPTSARCIDAAGGGPSAGPRRNPAHADHAFDGIETLGYSARLSAALTTVLAPDPESSRSHGASSHAAPAYLARHAPPIERYDPTAAPAWRDSDCAARHARLLQQAMDARTRQFTGRSTVRTLRAGTRIALASQGDFPAEAGLLAVVRVIAVGINNLPRPAQESIDRLLGPLPELLAAGLPALLEHNARLSGTAQHGTSPAAAALIAQAQTGGYANAFDALPVERNWRPVLADGTGERWRPTATAPGSQTAVVVGADGETVPNGSSEVHCDRLGRVRIRFLWQDAMAAGGAAGQARASCWVRVAQRAAGPGMGMHFLPRIGQEVLIQFIGGDIEQPVVVGAVYNGCGVGGMARTPGGKTPGDGSDAAPDAFASARDHAGSAQGNLTGGHSPVWHGASPEAAGHRNPAAQWGIRSKEHGGDGYNQLLFDDTPGQGRIQLKTTHAGTELNLGHLIHSVDNYRGSFRGLGVELRTDAYGAVRAGAGLLLSTYGRTYGASGRDMANENTPGAALLSQAHDVLRSCSRAADAYRTVPMSGVVASQSRQDTAVAARFPYLHAQPAGKLAGIGESEQPISDTGCRPPASASKVSLSPIAGLVKNASGIGRSAGQEWGPASSSSAKTVPGKETVSQSSGGAIALAAKAGWAMTADGGIGLHTGTVTAAVAGRNWQSTVGGTLRVHAGQAIGLLAGAMEDGMKRGKETGLAIIAARGPVTVQAQQGDVKLQAKGLVNIQSAHGPIDWAGAKKVTLATAGGARITIDNGNITVGCPGKLTIHAAQKRFEGPVRVEVPLPQMPQSICIECLLSAQQAGSPFAMR